MKDGLPDLQQGRHGLLLIDPYNDFISPVFYALHRRTGPAITKPGNT
jgi:hypothetical protein